jgi:hypothetical protein
VKPFGFCYVADCDAYIDEAMVSIASLKRHMPDVPVALVTRRDLFRPSSPVNDWVELQQTRPGPIVKTDARLAPYERVAFLDTDTLVTAELLDVFSLLDRFDLAFAPEPNGRPDYGLGSGVPAPFVEPNSGFFAFRKSAEMQKFFKLWLEGYDELNGSRGIANDQPALRIALWKSESIRHVTLGSEYNLIVHASCGVSGKVAVLHDRSPDRGRLAATINRHVEPRAIIAGFGPVFGFVTRRGWARQYARLSWNFLRVLLRPNLARQRGHPVVWWRDGVD